MSRQEKLHTVRRLFGAYTHGLQSLWNPITPSVREHIRSKIHRPCFNIYWGMGSYLANINRNRAGIGAQRCCVRRACRLLRDAATARNRGADGCLAENATGGM